MDHICRLARTLLLPSGMLKRPLPTVDVLLVLCAATICFCFSLYGLSGATRGVTRFQLNDAPRSILSMLYPAVFYAGGHGMGTADIDKIPGLEAFIFNGTPQFNLNNIPENVSIVPLDTPFERTHLYLLYCVGIFWRIFGVSHATLRLFCSFLCALSACMLYGIFRLCVSRGLSLLGAILICLSPLMLSSSLELRDYGKAPFFLCMFLMLGVLISRKLPPLRFLLLSVGIGIVLGFGVGMRPDLMISLPPALLTIIFARVEANRSYLPKLSAVIGFILSFLVVSQPALKGMAMDSGQQLTHHSYFMGLSDPYERAIGFGEASYADFSFPDEVIIAMVNTYARRMGDYRSMINPATSEYKRSQGDLDAPLTVDPLLLYRGDVYGQMGRKLMWEYIKTFPADLVARAWCALVASINAHGENSSYGFQEDALPQGAMKYFVFLQERLASHLGRYGLLYTLLALLGISTRSIYLAFVVAALMAWFGGSTSLSFQYRHVFHLAFIPALAMLMLLEAFARNIYALRGKEAKKILGRKLSNYRRCLKPLFAMSLFLVLSLCAVVFPLAVLRAFQERQVIKLADKLSSKNLIPLAVNETRGDGRVFIEPQGVLPGLEVKPHGEAAWTYLAIEIQVEGQDTPIAIEYSDEDADQMVLFAGDTNTPSRVVVFFPVYEIALFPNEQMVWDLLLLLAGGKEVSEAAPDELNAIIEQILSHRRQLAGISFPEDSGVSFEGFYMIEDVKDLHILPFMQVPDNRRDLRTHKTCSVERRVRSMCSRLFAR